MPQAVHSGSEAKFSRFWCQYLQAHAHAGTRALHYLGTIVGFLSIIVAVLVCLGSADRCRRKKEEAPDGECQGLFRFEMERMGWAGGPSPSPNYHLARINQPNIKEAPAKRQAEPRHQVLGMWRATSTL